MKLQKVKLITINRYPSEKPYIGVGDFFIDFQDNHIYECYQNHHDKKVLKYWQPIKFAIVYFDDEDSIIINHDEILTYKFRCEMLDEVLTEGGVLATKFRDSDFDISLCELIILADHGICWIDESKKIIHLQENQTHVSKTLLTD